MCKSSYTGTFLFFLSICLQSDMSHTLLHSLCLVHEVQHFPLSHLCFSCTPFLFSDRNHSHLTWLQNAAISVLPWWPAFSALLVIFALAIACLPKKKKKRWSSNLLKKVKDTEAINCPFSLKIIHLTGISIHSNFYFFLVRVEKGMDFFRASVL